MKILENYQSAFRALPPEIRAAEVEAEKEAELTVTLVNGKKAGAASSDVTELFIRTLGEKTGFTYTQCLEEDPLEVLQRAHESSQYAAGTPAPMSGKSSCAQGFEEEEAVCSLRLLWEKAYGIDQWLQRQEIPFSVRQVSVTDRVRTVGFVTSGGGSAQSSRHTYTVVFCASYHGETAEECAKEYSFPTPEAITEDCFAAYLDRWKRRLMAPVQAVNGSFRCLLDRAVMVNIFMTGWQMFSGMEHAGTLFGNQGETAASPLVTLTDKPLAEGSGYQYVFDCEGTPAREQKLITAGVFTGLLHNLTSAQSSGQASAGNAGRKVSLGGGIFTEIRVTPQNFCMERGASTFAEMIAGMEEGLYIYESFDTFHSVHFATGEFSIPCSGIYVKDGKLQGVVKGLTIMELLRQVEAVGSEVDFAALTMLHSYTIGMPDVLVKKLSVST